MKNTLFIIFYKEVVQKLKFLNNSIAVCLLLIGCGNPIVTGILPDVVKPLAGSVVITGNDWAGETLSADTSSLGGLGAITYQWMRGGLYTGANSADYVIEVSDAGEPITVTVSRAGNTGTVTSNAVTAKARPPNAGAEVSGPPTVFGIPAPGSITVNAVSIPDNPGGQTVEYAISTADGADAASLQWQQGATFSGLSAAVNYYVYARSAKNADYTAGGHSVSAAICFYTVAFDANGASSGEAPAEQAALPNTVITLPAAGGLAKTGYRFGSWNTQADGNGDNYIFGHAYQVNGNTTLYAKWVAQQQFPFPFELPANPAPTASGVTISQSGAGHPVFATLELTNADEFDLIEWNYGTALLGTGSTCELDAGDIRYNVEGTHNITVVAWKGGIPYSRAVSFVVVR